MDACSLCDGEVKAQGDIPSIQGLGIMDTKMETSIINGLCRVKGLGF